MMHPRDIAIDLLCYTVWKVRRACDWIEWHGLQRLSNDGTHRRAIERAVR